MNQNTGQCNATLAILAGGKGSRMGMPKGLLEIRGVAILKYLLERFTWDGPTMLVTAPGREHPPGWEKFDRELVDAVADQGPLRGVLTALENAATEIVVVTTVDMPLVSREQLRWLYAKMEESRGLGLLIDEPFPSAFRTEAADVIQSRIERGELSVAALKGEPKFQPMAAPSHWPREMWTNLNNIEDLKKL